MVHADVYNAIICLLEDHTIQYSEIDHKPCKTSDESKKVRAEAGYPNTVGAKALLTKLYFTDRDEFATIVLPGDHILDRDLLVRGVPNLKKMRFVTPEEMLHLAGVVPGCMPPFATPIFSEIPILIVATALKNTKEIGFNIASLEKSVILKTQDYLSLVNPMYSIDCSTPKENS